MTVEQECRTAWEQAEWWFRVAQEAPADDLGLAISVVIVSGAAAVGCWTAAWNSLQTWDAVAPGAVGLFFMAICLAGIFVEIRDIRRANRFLRKLGKSR